MKRVVCAALIAFSSIVMGCGASGDTGTDSIVEDGDEIDSVRQALTWAGEVIERDDNGSSWTMYTMYTVDIDGNGDGKADVCGGAPGDYIVYYDRPGAYTNRTKLRMDGFGLGGAQCALNLFLNKLSSRVYDNDRVWVCAGASRVDACGGPSQVFPFWGLWQVP